MVFVFKLLVLKTKIGPSQLKILNKVQRSKSGLNTLKSIFKDHKAKAKPFPESKSFGKSMSRCLFSNSLLKLKLSISYSLARQALQVVLSGVSLILILITLEWYSDSIRSLIRFLCLNLTYVEVLMLKSGQVLKEILENILTKFALGNLYSIRIRNIKSYSTTLCCRLSRQSTT
jgi:hypothetical protein